MERIFDSILEFNIKIHFNEKLAEEVYPNNFKKLVLGIFSILLKTNEYLYHSYNIKEKSKMEICSFLRTCLSGLPQAIAKQSNNFSRFLERIAQALAKAFKFLKEALGKFFDLGDINIKTLATLGVIAIIGVIVFSILRSLLSRDILSGQRRIRSFG